LPEFTDKQVEAKARRILRAKIKAMPWHAGLLPEECKRLIDVDVHRWWRLEVREAAKRLLSVRVSSKPNPSGPIDCNRQDP
jgi:hypothetical protein